MTIVAGIFIAVAMIRTDVMQDLAIANLAL
jgi:hypothetical protein